LRTIRRNPLADHWRLKTEINVKQPFAGRSFKVTLFVVVGDSWRRHRHNNLTLGLSITMLKFSNFELKKLLISATPVYYCLMKPSLQEPHEYPNILKPESLAYIFTTDRR